MLLGNMVVQPRDGEDIKQRLGARGDHDRAQHRGWDHDPEPVPETVAFRRVEISAGRSGQHVRAIDAEKPNRGERRYGEPGGHEGEHGVADERGTDEPGEVFPAG